MPDELEQLLKQLPLRPPSPNLDARMRDLFASAPRRPSAFPWRLFSYAGLAAACLLVSATAIRLYAPDTKPVNPTVPNDIATELPPQPPLAEPSDPISNLQSPISNSPPSPVRYQQVDSRYIDQGVIILPDAGPVRRFRQQTVQQVYLFDPRTRTYILTTVPQEQTVYVRSTVY